jgi:hypothetical protein
MCTCSCAEHPHARVCVLALFLITLNVCTLRNVSCVCASCCVPANTPRHSALPKISRSKSNCSTHVKLYLNDVRVCLFACLVHAPLRCSCESIARMSVTRLFCGAFCQLQPAFHLIIVMWLISPLTHLFANTDAIDNRPHARAPPPRCVRAAGGCVGVQCAACMFSCVLSSFGHLS